jgi:hypothetical protein
MPFPKRADESLQMKIPTFIAALLILFSVERSHGAEELLPATNSIQQDYVQLLKIKCFAFGGVGIAGSTSEGELAYRAVLASTNAVALFTATLSKGTDEAKLYALCGIHSLKDGSFDVSAKILKEADPKVFTMSGCIGTVEKASVVIERIADGTYDGP